MRCLIRVPKIFCHFYRPTLIKVLAGKNDYGKEFTTTPDIDRDT
jgi:hypothetical protein